MGSRFWLIVVTFAGTLLAVVIGVTGYFYNRYKAVLINPNKKPIVLNHGPGVWYLNHHNELLWVLVTSCTLLVLCVVAALYIKLTHRDRM